LRSAPDEFRVTSGFMSEMPAVVERERAPRLVPGLPVPRHAARRAAGQPAAVPPSFSRNHAVHVPRKAPQRRERRREDNLSLPWFRPTIWWSARSFQFRSFSASFPPRRCLASFWTAWIRFRHQQNQGIRFSPRCSTSPAPTHPAAGGRARGTSPFAMNKRFLQISTTVCRETFLYTGGKPFCL